MDIWKEGFNPMDRAWIELDMDALHHNIETLRALLPRGCALMPAVKANAYGHGAVLIAQELNQAGIEAFCVATALEGVELRKNGITGEILILGYTHPRQFPLLRSYHLTQAILDGSYAKELNAFGDTIKVQIKIDTGMHRLGERWDEADKIARIFDCHNLQITGAFTHLCADNTVLPREKAFILAQAHAFYDAVAGLEKRGCIFPKVHILASYGLFNYPKIGGDYARIGIALYGVLSNRKDSAQCPADLRPVLSLKARVAQVKELYKGESAGYDLKFISHRDTKIAVIAIGYADGLPRSLSCGVGSVLINGHKAPIAGRICMDQALVDITGIPAVAPGDIAVLIGRCGSLEISACDLAEQTGTISNEILSRLGARMERMVNKKQNITEL